MDVERLTDRELDQEWRALGLLKLQLRTSGRRWRSIREEIRRANDRLYVLVGEMFRRQTYHVGPKRLMDRQ